ncbi:MAG: hypothetical protein KGD63_01430 [Candidatus Lokiarchaeota archaeon]|nr:hypothetical protein [Candidatus Lokiarchaeota archaeon]
MFNTNEIKNYRNWKKKGLEGISKLFSNGNENIRLNYERCLKIFEYDWNP